MSNDLMEHQSEYHSSPLCQNEREEMAVNTSMLAPLKDKTFTDQLRLLNQNSEPDLRPSRSVVQEDLNPTLQTMSAFHYNPDFKVEAVKVTI